MFNPSIPPRDLKGMKAQVEAANMFADMLAGFILESDAPEEQKIGVRICGQAKKVCDAVNTITSKFADPELDDNACFEVRKQALEYLSCVEVGLKQFMEITKLPSEI